MRWTGFWDGCRVRSGITIFRHVIPAKAGTFQQQVPAFAAIICTHLFLQEIASAYAPVFSTYTVIPAKDGTRLFTRFVREKHCPGLRRDDGIY